MKLLPPFSGLASRAGCLALPRGSALRHGSAMAPRFGLTFAITPASFSLRSLVSHLSALFVRHCTFSFFPRARKERRIMTIITIIPPPSLPTQQCACNEAGPRKRAPRANGTDTDANGTGFDRAEVRLARSPPPDPPRTRRRNAETGGVEFLRPSSAIAGRGSRGRRGLRGRRRKEPPCHCQSHPSLISRAVTRGL